MTARIHLASIAALAASLASAAAAGADWNGPQEPFALYGNSYYVGTHGLSSVLITSPAGHILIDGGSPDSPRQIAAHVRQLGFKVEDIKYILNSHVHYDHAGGIAELQRLSGAKVLSSVAGEPVLRTGRTSKSDPQYTSLPPSMPAVANTRAVRDGEVVRLGTLAVTAHYTPGHTPGGTSWSWRSSEGGRSVELVYADSLNAIASKPFRYSGSPAYPTARADLERSIGTAAALPCEILVSAHPEGSGLWERHARRATAGNRAFIDRGACRDYAAKARALLAETLAKEAAEAQPVAGGYGFNWLDPEHAACRKLRAEDLAKATCTANANAFGLELKSRACRVSEHVELIVYKTAAQCGQGLETMQANGD
jgi:metallo-beta-lactamase class B